MSRNQSEIFVHMVPLLQVWPSVQTFWIKLVDTMTVSNKKQVFFSIISMIIFLLVVASVFGFYWFWEFSQWNRRSKEKDDIKASTTSTRMSPVHSRNTSAAQQAASTIKSYYPDPNLIEDDEAESISEPLLKGVAPYQDRRQVDPEVFKVNRLEDKPIVDEIEKSELVQPSVESVELNQLGKLKKMRVKNIFSNPIFEGDVLVYANDPKDDMEKITPKIVSLSSFHEFKQFADSNVMDILKEYSIFRNGLTMTVHLAVADKRSFNFKEFLKKLSESSDLSDVASRSGTSTFSCFDNVDRNIVAIIYERPEACIKPEFTTLDGATKAGRIELPKCLWAKNVFNNKSASAMFKASNQEMAKALQESQLSSEIAYGDYLQKMGLSYVKKTVHLLEQRNQKAIVIIAANHDVDNVYLAKITDEEMIEIPKALENTLYAILIVFEPNGN